MKRLHEITQELALLNHSLGEALCEKSQKSKEKAQILKSLKKLNTKIARNTDAICKLEKEKSYVLKFLHHKLF